MAWFVHAEGKTRQVAREKDAAKLIFKGTSHDAFAVDEEQAVDSMGRVPVLGAPDRIHPENGVRESGKRPWAAGDGPEPAAAGPVELVLRTDILQVRQSHHHYHELITLSLTTVAAAVRRQGVPPGAARHGQDLGALNRS